MIGCGGPPPTRNAGTPRARVSSRGAVAAASPARCRGRPADRDGDSDGDSGRRGRPGSRGRPLVDLAGRCAGSRGGPRARCTAFSVDRHRGRGRPVVGRVVGDGEPGVAMHEHGVRVGRCGIRATRHDRGRPLHRRGAEARPRARHRVGRLAEAIERGIRRRDPQADHRAELGQVPGPDAPGVESPRAAGRAQVDDGVAADDRRDLGGVLAGPPDERERLAPACASPSGTRPTSASIVTRSSAAAVASRERDGVGRRRRDGGDEPVADHDVPRGCIRRCGTRDRSGDHVDQSGTARARRQPMRLITCLMRV